MTEKFLMFSLDDEKSKKLGEVISNPTCKKIIDVLSEKRLSETDIAKELKIPVNTVEYNLKKLVGAGIVETAKDYFWSVKGKKIPVYQIANKLIVISPKKTIASKLKGIVPVVLISGVLTSLVAWYYKSKEFAGPIAEKTFESSENVIRSAASAANQVMDVGKNAPTVICNFTNLSWEWFLIGSLITLIVFVVWNWKKL